MLFLVLTLNMDFLATQVFTFFLINNGNISTICEIFSNLTMKTPEWHQWHRSGVFIVNFEQDLPIVLVFPLSTLNK